MQAGLDSTSNLEIYVAFEPSTNLFAGSTLTLQFPDEDDTDWCAVAGSDLVVTGVSSTPADSTVAYTVTGQLPGTLSGTCSQGSTGSSDEIVISGIGALYTGDIYGVQISGGTTAKLGTSTAGGHIVSLTVDDGSNIETKSFGIDLVANDTVEITAEVLEPPTVTCSISTNSVSLGSLYAGGSYVIGTHTLNTYTSDNAAGYYWVAYGQGDGTTNAGLYKSTATTYLIESDNSNSTVDLSVADSEGFGMNVEVPTGEAVAGTGFGDNSAGVFGTLGMGVDNSELIAYRNWGPQTTPLDTTITYGARAGNTAVPGSYTEQVTFICGGYIGGYADEPEMTGMSLPSGTTSETDSGGTSEWITPTSAQTEDDTYTYSEVGTGGTCLAEDTLISTDKGEIPISDIDIGDMVYSYNLDTQEIELSEVGNVVNTPITEAKSKYYNIYYENEFIKATYNHRFFVDGEYILAQDLKVGDYLLNNKGELKEISSILIEENSTETVWDLAVNGNHNFFANGVLVHNAGVYDDKVRLIKGGTVGSTDRAVPGAWQSTPNTTIYGGPSDLWGTTWTAEDLNASTFGVAISTYGSGYTTNSTSEYLKTTDFGLSVPTGATIQGIEVRVRKRLRSGSSVYSDIDYVKVRVYYEYVPWTLNFNDINHSCYGSTNAQTIPEDTTLYLEITGSSGINGFGVSFTYDTLYPDWNNETTHSFYENDSLTIYIGHCIIDEDISGVITIRENNSEGRIVDQFNYDIGSTGDCGPCPI